MQEFAEEKLSERKKMILFSAVEDYIANATPITSGAVHSKYVKDISTATLRNELNALEAMGYLKQIHTSSGRVPTTKSYRVFVNDLMKTTSFDKKSLEQVKHIFNERSLYLSEIVDKITTKISNITNYPAVFVINGYDKLIIESIKIFPLIDKTAIILIGTRSGVVNQNIAITSDITEKNCIDASNFLTSHFKGKTIKEMMENITCLKRELFKDIKNYETLFNNIVDGMMKFISNSSCAFKGAVKLLNNPEYQNIKSAKEVINFLDNEGEIKNLFTPEQTSEDINITIGKENEREELKNCSIIRANYNIDGENVASIGIIGPERMDYARLTGALKYIVDELKNINQLENKGGNNNE